MAPRRRLSCFIAPDAYEGWDHFARARGLSLTAFVEALGHDLARLDRQGILEQGALRRAVEAAGPLSKARRSRRGTGRVP